MVVQALLFLASAVVDFFAALCLLRFLMQAMRVSFTGPLGHFVVTLTNWAVKPLRRVLPPAGSYDTASLFATLALEGLLAGLIVGAQGAAALPAGDLAVLLLMTTVRNTLRLAVHLFIGALILQAVLSWFNPRSPLNGPVWHFTQPLLSPLRRFVPVISGIDLSPLVAILLLQVVLMFL